MKIGKISENAMKRSILQQIKTKREEIIIGAAPGVDCAIFSLFSENVMISCTQDGELKIALQNCANILAARGAEGLAVSLSILLPADGQEETLKNLMAEAEHFCAGLQMQIAEARGRVTEAVVRPFVTVTAYGRLSEPLESAQKAAYHTVKAAKPGQDIVVSKWIGLEGTAILAGRHRDGILERYPAWLVDEAAGFDRYRSVLPEAAVAIKSGVCAIHNVSEGGILAALWELAEGAGVGLTIDLKKLPIRQETVEICNHCNVNPYELLSGGCLLMTTTDGLGLVTALQQKEIPAVVVGKTTDSKDRLILNEDEVRYLDRPHEDSIYEKGFEEKAATAAE